MELNDYERTEGRADGVFPLTDFYGAGVEKLRSLREDMLRGNPKPGIINNLDQALAGLNRLNASLSGELAGRLEKSSRYRDDLLLINYLSGKTADEYRRKQSYLGDLDGLGEKYLGVAGFTGEFRKYLISSAKLAAELEDLAMRYAGAREGGDAAREEELRAALEDGSDRYSLEVNVTDGLLHSLTSQVFGAIRALELAEEEKIAEYLKNALETQFGELRSSVVFCGEHDIPYAVYARSFGGDGSPDEVREMTTHYLAQYLDERREEGRRLSAFASLRPGYSNSVFLKYINVIKQSVPLIRLLDAMGRTLRLDEMAERRAGKIYAERMSAGRRPRPDQISGITLGNNLSYVLPEELARLADPDLTLLFDLRLINSELLAFDFYRMTDVFTGPAGGSGAGTPERKKGPVIVCVDTSGSMKGEAEDYAKAVVMVLALKCLEADRPCYIINFAIEIETLKISLAAKEKSLDDLNAFLRRSFRGGTSIDNALQKVCAIIREDPDFAAADLLCVTDAKYSYGPETVEAVRATAREYGTRFYEFVKGFASEEEHVIFDKVFVIGNGKFMEI